jgi:ketosteroid isomerase-like protein
MSHPREEIEEVVGRYRAVREEIDAGQRPWSDLAAFFTDDAVYIDPAWGRMEGIDEMRRILLGDAMDGLESWRFPIDFHAIAGDTVVIKWRQIIPGTDGRDHQQSGCSTLVYAGDGRFRYCEDLLNMAHVMEDFAASGFSFPPESTPHAPPATPDRDFSIPPA